MICTIQALSILHWAGVYSGLLAVPVGIVVLAILFMVAVLIRDCQSKTLARKKDNGRADALLMALWHENTQLGSYLTSDEQEHAA